MASGPSLVEAKLRALARSSTGCELTDVDGALGAGLGDGPEPGTVRAFYLADSEPRSIGRALHWAASRRAVSLDILAEGGAGDLARRASHLSEGPAENPGPSISVWEVNGANAEPASAAPLAPPPTIPNDHWTLAGLMSEAGARPVDDHGVLVAEVAGLEVGRVIDDGSGPRIDVGVGQADRELSHMIHRNDEPGEGLRRVIAAVIEFRRAGSHHPLTRVGRERWLRSLLLESPGLVGAASLEPVVPLRPRGGLRDADPSAAFGETVDGGPIVVVANVGADLDLMAEAGDYRHRCDPEAELVLAMPERDLALSVGQLDRLPNARAVALETPWLT